MGICDASKIAETLWAQWNCPWIRLNLVDWLECAPVLRAAGGQEVVCDVCDVVGGQQDAVYRSVYGTIYGIGTINPFMKMTKNTSLYFRIVEGRNLPAKDV